MQQHTKGRIYSKTFIGRTPSFSFKSFFSGDSAYFTILPPYQVFETEQRKKPRPSTIKLFYGNIFALS
jgi:hypothetical protein